MPIRLRSASLATLASLLIAACAHGPDSRERKTAEIHHDLGVEALRAGRAPEAAREFDAAIELDPRFAEAWLGKGLVLERAFNKDVEAERAYRRAIELNPAYAEAWTDLGQLLARTGKTQAALEAFDAALAEMSNREPWVARFNKGVTLYWSSRRDEGMAEMQACLRGQPAYCEGHRLLGKILLDEGKVKEATEEFRSYVRYCDRVADAHLQLGSAHMKAQDVEAARAEFERCIQLSTGTVLGEECRKKLELLK
jgi:Tfp pilus assembly protein PilF